MFEKILYPTDFSDVAQKALNYIKQLKDSGTREVVVLHVIDARGFDSAQRLLGDKEFEMLEKKKIEETEKRLAELVNELTAAGLEVRSRIETGVPVKEILRVETEEDVSVLVIGSHGWSNLQDTFAHAAFAAQF